VQRRRLEAYLYWDGARLHALWHPNVAAGYFMIGIGFSLAFCFLTRKKLVKVLLGGGIVLQLMAMALTNCRTTLLLTGAMLGGTVFFLMCKGGGWKRMVLGLLAAAVILVGCFKLSGMLFQWNNDRLIADLTAVQAEPSSASAVPVPEAETAEVISEEQEGSTEETAAKEVVLIEDTGILQGDNEQRSLSKDMRTLNGRTLIWKAALKAIRNDKKLALWGTEYSGTVISVYNPFPVVHAHNSWMETLMRMGLPGLMMSLVFTALSVWSAAKLILSPETLIWKKIIAMLAMCVMASGFLEPYLFITNVYYHVTDFIFFFLTGYLDFWSNRKENL
jgi:O-antigen ligase